MPRIKVSEPGKTPQPYRVKLDREEIKFGRAGGNDIKLEDPSTSSNHCVIKRVDGGFIVEDLNSTNGMKLDDVRFSIIDLNQDTEFKLGDVKVEFELSDEEYDELAEEDDFESKQKPMLPKKNKKAPPKDDDIVPEDDEEEEERPRKRRKKPVEDEWDDEEEDKAPQSKLKAGSSAGGAPVRRAERLASHKSSGVSFGVIILAILAFVGGMCLKHYQKNQTFLFSELFGGKK